MLRCHWASPAPRTVHGRTIGPASALAREHDCPAAVGHQAAVTHCEGRADHPRADHAGRGASPVKADLNRGRRDPAGRGLQILRGREGLDRDHFEAVVPQRVVEASDGVTNADLALYPEGPCKRRGRPPARHGQ